VPRFQRTHLPLVAALLAVAAFGVWVLERARYASLGPGSAPFSNVLLITIDTLRVDRVGAYGGASGLTPTLDHLADRGIRFESAYTPVPMTLPAHASILTGLEPFTHGIRNNTGFKLGSTRTLATMLRRAGYRTGAFVGAFVLSSRFGLDKDFDVYDESFDRGSGSRTRDVQMAERPAELVVRPAVAWILRRTTATDSAVPAPKGSAGGDDRPWFAWIHLYDPHAPYQAPADYRVGRTPYDAEVAYTDAMIGRGLEELRGAGQLDRTIVLVVADHGEALGDHGETSHGLFAYESTLRVPMIMTVPGVRPRIVNEPVASVDLVPTVLDVLGIAIPSGLDGRSLFGVQEPGTGSARALYFEALDANLTRGWAPLTGVIVDGWKFIELPVPELYDLEHDPGETNNLAPRERERSRLLRERLKSLVAGKRQADEADRSAIDAETRRRLASLGYVGTVDAIEKRMFTEADDPKKLVGLNELFYAAINDERAGQPQEALTKLQAVVADRPDFVTARLSAAAILSGSGRADEAVRMLQSAPGAERSETVQTQLGLALEATGNLVEAAKCLEAAARLNSEDAQTLNSLGVVYSRLRRFDDGRRAFMQALRADPRAAAIWNNLGILEMTAGNRRVAIDALRLAVAADPDYAGAWQRLGAALVASDVEGAVKAWQRAVSLDPLDFDTLFNLGIVLADSPEPRESLPYLKRFASDAPPERYAGEIARVTALILKIEGH
jgi:arylsulfatase A-like enzyme/Flp pilus assembly protein TadD